MKGTRTGLEFENHELLITEQEGLIVHHLKKPDSIHDNIKFINTNGILSVTGDYGNWIFCRSFVPSEEGSVSEQYWLEKLRNSSCQQPCEYDAEDTVAALKELLNGGLEEYGYSGERLDEMRAYYEKCLENTDDEFEYIQIVRDYPSFADHECMIVRKKLNVWLPYIFDGFEEMCRRIKEGEPTILNKLSSREEKYADLLIQARAQLLRLKPNIATDDANDMAVYNLIHNIKATLEK